MTVINLLFIPKSPLEKGQLVFNKVTIKQVSVCNKHTYRSDML